MLKNIIIASIFFIIIGCCDNYHTSDSFFNSKYHKIAVDKKLTLNQFQGVYSLSQESMDFLKEVLPDYDPKITSLTLYKTDSSENGIFIFRNVPKKFSDLTYEAGEDLISFGQWDISSGFGYDMNRILNNRLIIIEDGVSLTSESSFVIRLNDSNKVALSYRFDQYCGLIYEKQSDKVEIDDLYPFLFEHDSCTLKELHQVFENIKLKNHKR